MRTLFGFQRETSRKAFICRCSLPIVGNIHPIQFHSCTRRFGQPLCLQGELTEQSNLFGSQSHCSSTSHSATIKWLTDTHPQVHDRQETFKSRKCFPTKWFTSFWFAFEATGCSQPIPLQEAHLRERLEAQRRRHEAQASKPGILRTRRFYESKHFPFRFKHSGPSVGFLWVLPVRVGFTQIALGAVPGIIADGMLIHLRMHEFSDWFCLKM